MIRSKEGLPLPTVAVLIRMLAIGAVFGVHLSGAVAIVFWGLSGTLLEAFLGSVIPLFIIELMKRTGVASPRDPAPHERGFFYPAGLRLRSRESSAASS